MWALEAEDPHLSHSFATCLMITLGKLLKPFMPQCSHLFSAVTVASATQGCCEEEVSYNGMALGSGCHLECATCASAI